MSLYDEAKGENRQQRLDELTLDALLHEDTGMLVILAGNRSLGAESLNRIARRCCARLDNDNTACNYLEIGAWENVFVGVIQNPNCTKRLLRWALQQDAFVTLRDDILVAYARQHSVPKDIIDRILESENDLAVKALADNRSVSKHIRDRAAELAKELYDWYYRVWEENSDD